MRVLIASVLVALGAGFGLPRTRGGALDKGTDDTPECVRWHTEARYSAYGYDHIVHIQNRCEAGAECLVWTNVHPDRIRVAVAADTDIDVLTYRGSPAREFTAHVKCELEEQAADEITRRHTEVSDKVWKSAHPMYRTWKPEEMRTSSGSKNACSADNCVILGGRQAGAGIHSSPYWVVNAAWQ